MSIVGTRVAGDLHWTVTGPSDSLQSSSAFAYGCMGVTLACCIGTIILVYPRATATKHVRPILLIATSGLFLVDTLNNMRVIDNIESTGAIDLKSYYIVRTLSFLFPAVTHLLAVGYRVALLVANKTTRRNFLIVLHAMCVIAYILAVYSMWTVAEAVAYVGTLHAWLWTWVILTPGYVAAVIFPVSNMVACAWSIHRAFYLRRVVTTPAPSPTPSLVAPAPKSLPSAASGSNPSLGPNAPSVTSLTPALPPRSNSGPKRYPNSTTHHTSPLRTARLAPFATSLSMSGGSLVTSAQVPMLRALAAATARPKAPMPAVPTSPAQNAATRAFWLISGSEIVIWVIYIVANATTVAWSTVWARNCFSAMLGSLLAVAEASLEMVYRFAYQKHEARSRVASGRRSQEGGSGSGVGGPKTSGSDMESQRMEMGNSLSAAAAGTSSVRSF